MNLKDFIDESKDRIVDLEKCFTGTLYDISKVQVLNTLEDDEYIKLVLTMEHDNSHAYELVYDKKTEESYIDIYDKDDKYIKGFMS